MNEVTNAAPRGKATSALINLALVGVSLAICFAGAEIALRLAYLKDDPWIWRNFTVEPVDQVRANLGVIDYDPLVGYVPTAMMWDGSNASGAMGERLNYLPETRPETLPMPPTGGIVAVGDSFTYGSEVGQDETWEAYLEKLIDVPVINFGAGGYGLDQAVLRAEQVVETLKPRAIIFSFIPNGTTRNEFSNNGGLMKSFFGVEDGELALHNVPVPEYRPRARHIGYIRRLFGQFYTPYWLSDRVGLRHRWLVYEHEYVVEHRNGIEVSCLLMGRLADLAEAHDTKVIVLAQYGGIQVSGIDNSRQDQKVEDTLRCAQENGLGVMDSYDGLLAVFEERPAEFWNFYVRQKHDTDINTGHMSPSGNLWTAEFIADMLRQNHPELLVR